MGTPNHDPTDFLQARDLTKIFGYKTALNRVNLSLEQGKTHILLGSSGSGKSTLLRIFMGLIPASRGDVLIQGSVVSPKTQMQWAFRIGYVPQEGGLFPHFTAWQNITLMARALAWTPEKIEERIAKLSPIIAFPHQLMDRYPKELSGGQRQKVSIFRAAFLDPELMMLDEPLAALDPIMRSELQMELKQIFQALGKTVIFVTHDIGEAAYLGDTITLLHEGRVVQSGSFQDLLNQPADPFVSQFIRAQRTLHDLGIQ